jgi:hypothetical protein
MLLLSLLFGHSIYVIVVDSDEKYAISSCNYEFGDVKWNVCSQL